MIEAPTDVTLTNQDLWTDDSAMEDDEIVGLAFGKATPFITKEDTTSTIDIDHTSSSTSNLDDKSLSKEDFFAIIDCFMTSVLQGSFHDLPVSFY